MIPGEKKDQYRRNPVRASASVAMARVFIRKTDSVPLIGAALIVRAILSCPGSLNATNWLGGSARNVTFASQGFVTAPTTTWRSGTSAKIPRPTTVSRRGAPVDAADRRVWRRGPPARSDDGSHHRRPLQIRFARDGERDIGWRGDVNVMSFHNVVERHELVEQRVNLVITCARWVPVP